MKKLFCISLVLLLSMGLFAQAAREETPSLVASTSWTAAFADLAGVDDLIAIAPSNLSHPPEYELVPSDIVAIQSADYFVYAGYERMMNTISEGIVSEDRLDIKISTGNDRAKVIEQAELIASLTGTTPRYESYVAMLDEAEARVAELGLGSLRVLCHTMQTPLAEDLGLNVVATFGGNEVTASQIEAAANGAYDLIIDNVHNPISGPLAEVSDAKVVVWRNFPETVERNALENTVRANIEALLELYN